jgi:hypothetical protein
MVQPFMCRPCAMTAGFWLGPKSTRLCGRQRVRAGELEYPLRGGTGGYGLPRIHAGFESRQGHVPSSEGKRASENPRRPSCAIPLL